MRGQVHRLLHQHHICHIIYLLGMQDTQTKGENLGAETTRILVHDNLQTSKTETEEAKLKIKS